MIRKLICYFTGHKRGVFTGLMHEQGGTKVIGRMFICPRCDTTWTRKVKT